MSNNSALAVIPFEPSPNLQPAVKKRKKLTADDNDNFITTSRLALVISGVRKLFTATTVRNSASVFILVMGPNQRWHVLVKKEAKAFLHKEVLTPPGGYTEEGDKNRPIRNARNRLMKETGIDIADIDCWVPAQQETNKFIDLDNDVAPASYPNNLTNTGANRLELLKDKQGIPEDAYENDKATRQSSLLVIIRGPQPLMMDAAKLENEGWCLVPAFPQSTSATHRTAWSHLFNPHGVMGNGLYRVRDYMYAEGLATYNGQAGPNWQA